MRELTVALEERISLRTKELEKAKPYYEKAAIKSKEGESGGILNIHKFIRYKDALMGFGTGSVASLDNGETWYGIGASGTWPAIVGDTLFSTEYSSKYFYKTGFTDYTTLITDSPLNDLLSNYVLSNMAESKGNLIVANLGQGTNVGIAYSEDYGRTFEMATFAVWVFLVQNYS